MPLPEPKTRQTIAMNRLFFRILVACPLAVLVASCSTTRRLAEGETLYTGAVSYTHLRAHETSV